MKLKASDYVLLALDAMGGRVRGRTLIQKRLYFLSVLTGHEDLLDFEPHYYGPYSVAVASALGRMVSLGFARQQQAIRRPSVRGFELSQTTYQLTADGRKVARWLANQYPDVAGKIENAWSVLRRAGKLDYTALSVAAKLHRLYRTSGRFGSPYGIVDWAEKRDIDKAMRFLDRLGRS